MLSCPVLFFIFNRPTLTSKVFKRIEQARPAKLFIVADGPRSDHPEDVRGCMEARRVVETISWPCEVRRNYAEENLGCKKRVASGIDWAFEMSDRAIILEDDCLPDNSFFPFCEELLNRYADEEQIMMIRGNSFLPARLNPAHSYDFSRQFYIWGWATWRRAWKHYDIGIGDWIDKRKNDWLNTLIPDESECALIQRRLDEVLKGDLDTWDYQWMFACWLKDGFAIRPSVNLISNLGFGEKATHTHDKNNKLAGRNTKSLRFPLIHPKEVKWSIEQDRIEIRMRQKLRSGKTGIRRFLPGTGIMAGMKRLLKNQGKQI